MTRTEAADLLGLPLDATAQEVQRAYLRAVRATHPDLLPDSDEAGRRAAGEAFDRLTRARRTMLEPVPARRPDVATSPRADWQEGPRYRRVEGRGLGGSLVVLALLAFLLVALVSLQQGFARVP